MLTAFSISPFLSQLLFIPRFKDKQYFPTYFITRLKNADNYFM